MIALAACIALITGAPPAAPVQQFAVAARVWRGRQLPERPVASVVRALDALLDDCAAALRAGRLKEREAEYAAASPDPKGAGATECGRPEVRAVGDRALAVIAVRWGAVSRVALYSSATGVRQKDVSGLGWMQPWSVEPRLSSDGTIVLLCQTVQDIGVRVGLRLVLVGRTAGGATKVTEDWTRRTMLDYGGLKLQGEVLTAGFLEEPRAFFTAAADDLFHRQETRRIHAGRSTLTRSTVDQPTLRAADDWLVAAKAARKPNAEQRAVRPFLADRMMLLKYRGGQRADRASVIYEFEEFSISFEIAKTAAGWIVKRTTLEAGHAEQDSGKG